MHVEDAGAGPPVLALHGLGGGAHFFDGLSERLKAEYRVLAVDLPGTGRSASTAAFSMESWVADLGELVERIADQRAQITRIADHETQITRITHETRITQITHETRITQITHGTPLTQITHGTRNGQTPRITPAVLLGHSMGAIIALKAWHAWPGRIRGLILVGGLPEVRPAIRERLSQRVSALEHVRDLSGWGTRVSPGVFSPATMRNHPDIVARFERAFEAQPVESYVRCTRILLGASAAAICRTVTVPTLLVTGADDQYAPPDAVKAFAREIPRAVQVEVLPDCGHLPFLERPDAFAAAVKSFLRTC